jgi:NhaP-type Na+/H+ or K+/H+ antiporter
MPGHELHPTVVMFGVVGTVVLLSALLSGVVERTRLPQVLILLLLGTAIGPHGLEVVELAVESPTIRVVATLALVMVLFTDAVDIALADLRHHARIAARILGPATLLTAAVIAVAAHWLLGTTPAESTILGAALASTDPVLLRGVLRSPSLPSTARYALRLEGGMNDAVLLPVILVAMSWAARGDAPEAGAMLGTAARGLLTGLGGGVVVGLIAVGALNFVRRRVGIRRDYESIYGFGVAVTAFAVTEAIGGSGFLAAFAAGLTIAALDVELCECFFDYGAATSELVLLFTFVTLGTSGLWRGLDEISGPALAFAAVALFARGPMMLAALAGSHLERRGLLLLAWFGPRGLSSLLLVLVPVFAGTPGAGRLFDVTALVVLLSVLVHGGSQMLLRPATVEGTAGRDREAAATPQAPAPATAAAAAAAVGEERPLSAPHERQEEDPLRISLEQLEDLRRRGERVVLLDVRTDASYRDSPVRAAAAVRVPPERAVAVVSSWGLPLDTWLVSYCT